MVSEGSGAEAAEGRLRATARRSPGPGFNEAAVVRPRKGLDRGSDELWLCVVDAWVAFERFSPLKSAAALRSP